MTAADNVAAFMADIDAEMAAERAQLNAARHTRLERRLAVAKRSWLTRRLVGPRPRLGRPRPRGRRERHVTRATSSASSGEPGEGEPPLAAARSEVEAGERCALCGTVGRLVVVGELTYPAFDVRAQTVACTVCWGTTDLAVWRRS